VALVAGLLIASRAATRPALNVNLAFSVWRAMGPLLDSPELHILALLCLWTIALWSIRQALVRLRLLRCVDGG
jgi:hypothetical protein